MNRSVKLMVIACAILWLGGCGGFASKQENVFNNENRLLEVGDSFTFSNKKGEINEEHAIIQYSGFSGVYTVWRMTSQEDISLKIKIQGNNKRGKFKLIQTIADQQLTTIWSGEKDEEVILNIPKGSSAIKWVGQKAAGELNIQLDTEDGLEVEPQADLFNGELFEGGLFGEE
ncbi:hypothetical protein CA600_17460 [Paenibacillus sp. VTT E-133280]|uniref:hypothetical protein n=1 Tax=Paenibacillus sp. VTT E-133280 TaxID=1986222 RepID=UPI000BA12103|nr:hypothetical protein [Paenibacillus sp. VTT E-133280]OZQ64200.1 hypothetical protein CA600_17460 [Paenibacillus sp. VTT E-133280]